MRADQMPRQQAVIDRELDRHDPIWEVMLCIVRAIRNLTGNDNIYADDDKGRVISFEEVAIIINHLKYSDECAIEVSDRVRHEEYMKIFENGE